MAKQGEHHILNLGAGVQSTTLYLMFMRGILTPRLDCAIFADTQEEPQAVYRHLEWLKSLQKDGGAPILTGTAGRIGDQWSTVALRLLFGSALPPSACASGRKEQAHERN